MTALLAVAALVTGAFLGFFTAAIIVAGKHEDECRICRRAALDQALREADGISYGGTDS